MKNKRIKRLEDREVKFKELQKDEKKTLEMIEEEMAEWDKNRDQEEAEDDDPEAPNLNTMLDEAKDKLIESRNTQHEFWTILLRISNKNSRISVVNINGDISIERVHLRVLSELKPYIEYQNSLIKRMQVMELKSTASKPNKNPWLVYERSYLYSHSKYGYRSPFNIARPDMNKLFSVLYRDKLYFFANEDEKNLFMMTPDIYWRNPTIPKDVWIKPTWFVLGIPSCGKSTVCQRVSSKTGMVHLKIEDIIPEFIKSDWQLGQQLRDQIKRGRRVSKDSMVVKRVQFSDWVTNGFLLEDFPKT